MVMKMKFSVAALVAATVLVGSNVGAVDWKNPKTWEKKHWALASAFVLTPALIGGAYYAGYLPSFSLAALQGDKPQPSATVSEKIIKVMSSVATFGRSFAHGAAEAIPSYESVKNFFRDETEWSDEYKQYCQQNPLPLDTKNFMARSLLFCVPYLGNIACKTGSLAASAFKNVADRIDMLNCPHGDEIASLAIPSNW